jgi:transcriptional regulator with PAS, ATPase and Fis domain
LLPDGGIDLQRRLHDVEREIIRRALEQTGGNKHRAALMLNIKRTTLVEKAKRLRL